jgi:hypothetical protein
MFPSSLTNKNEILKKKQMDFESKFVLPKKVPVFLNEFVGFMEKTNAIDQLTAQNFIVAVPDAWKDYSTKSRVRKVREKKDIPDPLSSAPPSSAPPSSATNNPRKLFSKLQEYIVDNVAEERVRNDLISIVTELLTSLN